MEAPLTLYHPANVSLYSKSGNKKTKQYLLNSEIPHNNSSQASMINYSA